MKTKHLLYLTLLLYSLLLVYTSAADAQDVHACLILMGNDTDRVYRASVDINQAAMIGLMQLVSRNADVHMTLMKSEPGLSGEVTHTHLVKMETKARHSADQLGVIKLAQVTEWIRNLKVGASDTIFIYFNGHGKTDRYGTHQLIFDKKRGKMLARDVVLEALREKPCRLKLLITDTCSTVAGGTNPAGGVRLAQYGSPEAKPQFYAKNLFLEHIGILDITATSPEIRTVSDTDEAYGDEKVGGFFTYALTSALVPDADSSGDDFLSWEEAFAATEAGVKRLCEAHPLFKAQNIIQRPVAHGKFPKPAELATDPFAEMVLIPAGEFQMGSNDYYDDEKPVHTVYVDAFYMDKYEVTNAQYKQFLDANPQWRKDRIQDRFHSHYLEYWDGNTYPRGKADHPVVYVSWYAAMAYAEWAGKRLPTEAEWEKAARGGLVGKKYPHGNTLTARDANYGDPSGTTTPVGSYPANGYGLYDMSGNVWEWCLDEYNGGFYAISPARNPLSGSNSIQWLLDNYTGVKTYRVLRGGSWLTNATYVRVADRRNITPAAANDLGGFRCARAVE